MSELKVKGTIVKVLEMQSGTSKAGKEWKRGGFVLNTGDEYNPEVCFSLFGEAKIDMLHEFTEGSAVEVAFNVSSREFNGKYYHNLDAWRLTGEEAAATQSDSLEPLNDDIPGLDAF